VPHSDPRGSATRSYRGFWLLLPLVSVLAFFLTVWIAAPLRYGAEPTAIFGAIAYYVAGLMPDFLGDRPAPPMQDVLVASADLRPPLTLSTENTRWQPWPDNALNSGFITRSSRPDALDTLAGSIVRRPMNIGEPIREANLVRRGDFRATPAGVSGAPTDAATKPIGALPEPQQRGELGTLADVPALMQKLGTKNRGFVESYINAPMQKALAREKGGSYLVESHGWRTVEEARQAALQRCQDERLVCEFVMENDHWLASTI
jgi:hypothetical protein